MTYQGNIGFQEMFELMDKVNPEQELRLLKIVDANDWDGYKQLTKEVLNVELH